MFVFQVTTNPIDAHAGAIQDTYISITSGIAFDLGYRACSYPCAAAAVGVMAAVNTYAPEVAKRAATKGKTDMKKMFTDWGSTYVRP
jgi:mannose/fructose/N-acetylgalactosamine-specific phosphotransferase system component IIC